MGEVQTRVQNARAPADIDADPATDDHPALLRVERSDPAPREAMAPARVRQRVDGLDHAWQSGDLDDLLVDLVVHDADQVLGGEENPRDAHGATGFDPPFDGGLLREATRIHKSPCVRILQIWPKEGSSWNLWKPRPLALSRTRSVKK